MAEQTVFSEMWKASWVFRKNSDPEEMFARRIFFRDEG